MIGRLVRQQIPVRLIDLSPSGCLLQSQHQIHPGATGELFVTRDGAQYRETLRVVRSGERIGPRLFASGGEFLWRTRRDQESGETAVRSIVPFRPR